MFREKISFQNGVSYIYFGTILKGYFIAIKKHF